MWRIGILLFNGVEELDVAGPYEVFAWAGSMREGEFEVFTVAENAGLVRCDKGLRIAADRTFSDCPQLDVILVPGGYGSRAQVDNSAVLSFIAEQAAGCEWVTSVCTGLRLLVAAGVADNRRATTYHGAIEEMRQSGRLTEVLDDVRFVRDGNIVTSAGVSAGIDMSLWLVGELTGDPKFARQVQKGIEYFPAPPYTSFT